ncbi:MAG: trypsin-like peptidase domain-containing protein [Acetatifactor sp.]
MSKKKMAAIVMGLVLFLTGLTTAFYFTYRIELISGEYIVELGDELNEEPSFYVSGTAWAVNGTEADFSAVDCSREGVYEVTLHHGWQNLTCNIVVQDTTPPTLKLKDDAIYLARDSVCDADMLVSKAKDLSGKVKLYVSEDGENFSREITLDSCGEHTLTVKAVDAYGNTREKSRKVIVDTAPVFGEFPEYYVAVDSNPDFLEDITAYDDVDGEVTEHIEADLSGLNLTEEGIGTVAYSVTDSYGLTSRTEMQVNVCSKDNLQKLINSHQINRFDQRIIGAYNLYDAGVYEEDDIEGVLEKLNPSFVRLKKEIGNGYTIGSGFVLEMTEDEIVICTNRHVVNDYSFMDVYFYDGTRAKGTVLGKTGRNAGENDVALVSVERKEIYDGLCQELKTVHVNMNGWLEMSNEPSIDVGLRCVDESGGIWKERSGVMLYKEKKPFQFESYGTFSEVSFELIHGMSGSAVVDGHGNLMGMAVCITTVNNKKHYWCVTLDHIAESYKEITGRCMYYE